jgi:hypothetical protein
LEFHVCTSQKRGQNIPSYFTDIADAQRKDQELKVYFKKNAKMPQKDKCLHLIEDTKVLCKNGKNNHSNISKAQGSQLIPP